MTFPIVTDDPASICDEPDGLTHISGVDLSDGAWAVAVSVGAVITALCGYRRIASPADPFTQPVCPTCHELVETSGMEVRS